VILRKAILFVTAVALVAITACSPVFNWREVRLEASGLTALLPCKPDRAARDVVFDTDQVVLRMAGCEAGGATFTIAYAIAHDATQACAWLTAWKAAMTNKLQAQTSVETQVEMRGAAAAPAPIQLKAEGNDTEGRKTPAQVWWFTQAAQSGQPGEVLLYQATMLGQPSEIDASATFFENLRLH